MGLSTQFTSYTSEIALFRSMRSDQSRSGAWAAVRDHASRKATVFTDEHASNAKAARFPNSSLSFAHSTISPARAAPDWKA